MYSIVLTDGKILNMKATEMRWHEEGHIIKFIKDRQVVGRINMDNVVGVIDLRYKIEGEDAISRKAVEEFVEYIHTIKDKHNTEGLSINYDTICDLVVRGWKLLESEKCGE